MLVTCVLRAYADIEKQVHANQMAWKHAGFTWSGFSVGTKETAGTKEKVEDMFSSKYVAEAMTRRKDLFTSYYMSLVADDNDHDEEEEAPAEVDVPPAPMSADQARRAIELDRAAWGWE